jgi:hypothetical protein
MIHYSKLSHCNKVYNKAKHIIEISNVCLIMLCISWLTVLLVGIDNSNYIGYNIIDWLKEIKTIAVNNIIKGMIVYLLVDKAFIT